MERGVGRAARAERLGGGDGVARAAGALRGCRGLSCRRVGTWRVPAAAGRRRGRLGKGRPAAGSLGWWREARRQGPGRGLAPGWRGAAACVLQAGGPAAASVALRRLQRWGPSPLPAAACGAVEGAAGAESAAGWSWSAWLSDRCRLAPAPATVQVPGYKELQSHLRSGCHWSSCWAGRTAATARLPAHNVRVH